MEQKSTVKKGYQLIGKRPFETKDIQRIKKQYIDVVMENIPKKLFEQAKKMKLDLVETSMKLLSSEGKRSTYESFVENLVGALGTIYANEHLEEQGLEVKNEQSITNKGKIVTASDISFEKDGVLNFLELKTTECLLLEPKEYDTSRINLETKEGTDLLKGNQTVPKEAIILGNKAKKGVEEHYAIMGQKLLTQLDKLNAYKEEHNGLVNINVGIFNGCNISPKLQEEIDKRNVRIITIPKNVSEIFDEVNQIASSIYIEGRNLLEKARNNNDITR